MSTKLSKALEFANRRTTLNNQNAALKAKTQSLLSYSTNGGTFTINRELISYVSSYLANDKDAKNVVFLDIYDNPILIKDLKEFSEEITSRYHEVINDYYAEYQKLRKVRKVQEVLDLHEDSSD